ncbi:MAG TPA: alcohol dehydrogenase [Planctomycetaceae bacterium]|nr:alcohol dehydrogenase [Planctomycetaceae bacterium]
MILNTYGNGFGLTWVLLVGAVTIWIPTTVARGEDWHRWRGPNSDGISRQSDWSTRWPNEKPNIAWTQSVGTGFSSIVVRGDHAFTIGHQDGQDVVVCLSVSDGREVWRYGYPASLDDRDFEGGPTSTPTVDGDRLYVLSRGGDLFCFDCVTGELVWQQQIADLAEVRLPGWGFSASPVVIGDHLLVNAGESGAAVNKQDGTLLWSSADRESGYATPVLIPDSQPTTAIFASSRAYIGVDIRSGEKLWSERWLTSFNCNAADPILRGDRMFLSSGYNRGGALYQFVDGQPQLLWKTKEMQNQLHTSILYQDHLYGIDGDMDAGARLKCLKWETGEVAWSVDDLSPGGMSIADGKLILITESGELIISPATPQGWNPIAGGQVIQGKCRTVPVLSGGRIYCRSVQGAVVCISCRD